MGKPVEKSPMEIQLSNLIENIKNLADHCEFHPGDKDAKRSLKALKARKKRLVTALRQHEKYHAMLLRLRLIKREAIESDKQLIDPEAQPGKGIILPAPTPNH